MERKSVLLLLAAAGLVLVSVPSVIFNNAIHKYFDFLGHWDVAGIKPSVTGVIPQFRPRPDRIPEPPQPVLRFVKFTVTIKGAKSVKIAGDFNKWDADSLELVKTGKKTWEAIVPLPPGRYKYVCVIDGQETLDPLNPDTDTEAGRKVSVRTVK